MRSFRCIAALAALLVGAADAQVLESTFSPARPPAIPLAVRNPYLSTWQQAGGDGGNGGYLAGQWPSFWDGSIVGWTGLVRVDGLTYTWMGIPVTTDNETPPVVNQTSFSYTSTRSIFTFNVAGTVNMTVTFLSGVYPNDLMRQSFPISFMDVQVASRDGKTHNVEVYTDISAEWISGDRTKIANWDYGTVQTGQAAANVKNLKGSADAGTLQAANPSSTLTTYATNTQFANPTGPVTHPTSDLPKTSGYINPIASTSPVRSPTTFAAFAKPKPTQTGGIAFHRIFLETQEEFSEVTDQTEYGNWYYVTDNNANLTYESGPDISVRGAFDKNGYLNNTVDPNYRAINDNYPVFGFAVDFGKVKQQVGQNFAVALSQEQAVQFEGAQGNVSLPSLWTQYYSNDEDALYFYYNDYNTASTMSTTLDNQIEGDSVAAGGNGYATLTTLATRQAFGALEFANTTEDPLAFMKEISSDGDANTVDVIFPFHPISLYLNPNILRMLLDPLYINQEAGFWPRKYSIHDLGTFPNATGHNDGDDEKQPVEECGNMILMTLAYAQRTGDTAYLSAHYSILTQWVDYLVKDSLYPANQLSTDDFAGPLVNSTNLAIKGIVGIQAMSVIANLTGHTKAAQNYSTIAHSYVDTWQNIGINHNAKNPHATLEYGNQSTFTLLYNIYPDKLLGLDLVPQQVFDMQSTFYLTKFNRYGVPLDERHDYTKGDWQLFCAAGSSSKTQAAFIDALALWVEETETNLPLTDLYDTTGGGYPDDGPTFINRPVVGGYFALLALNNAPASKRDVGIAGRLSWER